MSTTLVSLKDGKRTNMQGLKDLLASERGVFCIMMYIGITVGWFMGKIDTPQYLQASMGLTGILVVSKTVTTNTEIKNNNLPKAETVTDRQ